MPRILYPLFICVVGLFACSQQTEPAANQPAWELSVNEQANVLLARMTLEEKVGQIIQADIGFVTPEQVKTYNLGAVLNGGNSAPGGGKVAPASDWIDRHSYAHRLCGARGNGRDICSVPDIEIRGALV